MESIPGFSSEFQEAIKVSRLESIRLGNNFIGPEHLVLGVIRSANGPAFEILQTLTNIAALEEQLSTNVIGISRELPEPPEGYSVPDGSVALSDEAEAAIKSATVQKTNGTIGAEHILLSILESENTAQPLLNGAGVTAERVRARIG
jgi:ATP-dependent Clp protease ATP-binding subunit ClpC